MLGADAIEQMAGGDGDLLAGFVVARRRGLRRGRLHAADLAPGFVAATLGHQRLDAQQALLERLLLREPAGGSSASTRSASAARPAASQARAARRRNSALSLPVVSAARRS